MDPSTTTATPILPATLAAHGTLRLSYVDDAMTSGRAEAIDDRLVSVAAEDFARLAAAIGGFAEGTGIATPRGTKRVEDLVPGDRVVTRDAGVCSVRRIGRLHFGWRELGLLPVLRPVRLCRGTPGFEGLTRDLVAAPSLRVLAGNGSQTAFEPLAHHAARGGSVTRPNLLEVRYHMFSLDRPAAVMANGVWAEGFEGALAASRDGASGSPAQTGAPDSAPLPVEWKI